jgi:hypothetical protein
VGSSSGLAWLVLAALVASCRTAPAPAPGTPRPSPGTTAVAVDPDVVRALRETYSFKPHELTTKQIDEKSASLDGLWTAAAHDPKRYLPALRVELAGDRQVPFFYYDGGQLLMKLSAARDDRALALAALARVDLRDVTPLAYLQTVHGLARDGFDTSGAAFRILDDEKFTAYVPEHALELGRADSLRFMLLPSSHEAIGPAVVARYPKEKSEGAKRALLLVACDLAPAGDALVHKVATDLMEPASVRDYARGLDKDASVIAAAPSFADAVSKLLGGTPKKGGAVEGGLPTTVSGVLAKRRADAGRISDEALDDIEIDTVLLRVLLARDARKAR